MDSRGRTKVQLCGRLTVELDGRRFEDALPSRQGRLLFAYLALHRDRPVRRDELIDAIWPDRPPADAAAALNTLISRLRRAIGASAIVGKAELSLALPDDAEIDVVVAAEALARARSAAAGREWQATWGPAHAALAIAQRGLLPGLEAPWIERWRRELDELELEALELVAETGLGLGGVELSAAERSARTLVQRAPFRESGHALWMRVLAARGRVAEALQAYEELRRLLADELGTAPSASVLALHAALLQGTPPDDARGDLGSDFVGRRRELEVLERIRAESAAGSRRTVLVAGEAGIGKTRLADELGLRAGASGAQVVRARCVEGHGVPAFWPWMEVLRALASDASPERLRRALGPGAADVAQIVPELRELAEPPPAPPDPEAARFRVFDATSRFLARLAATRPLVLILDDLHWADAPSLQLLRFVAARPDDAALLLVGTYRDTDVSDALAELLAELAGERTVRRLALAGLDEAELGQLLAHATGAVAGEELVAAVHHRTAGNPFYVSQLVGELDAGAALDATMRSEVPGGVRDVIRRRLGALPPQANELLTIAAVVGEEVALHELARAAQLDEDAALDRVEAALAARMLVESPDAVGRYRFAHALIRETLYGELSAMRRARLHLRVADTLESLDDADADRVVVLAHHLYEAAPAGGAERAYAYVLRAADDAMARLGYEQAEHQLRRALELLQRGAAGPTPAERELDLQLRLGALLMMTKGYAAPDVGAACDRARELCLAGEVGGTRQLPAALWRLGVFYEVRGDYGRSSELGRELLELGSRTREPVYELGGRQLLGVAALEGGDAATALEHLAVARSLADALGEASAEVFGMDFRITSRAFSGWASSIGGDFEGGALADEALALARRLERPHDEAYALFVTAVCAVLRGDAVTAGARAQEGAALCAERGFALFGAMAGIVAGWAVSEAGDPPAGVAAIAEGLAAFQATGARMMLPLFLGLLARAQERAGDRAEALATVEEGLAEAAETGRFYEPELLRLRDELRTAPRPGPAPASA